MKVKTKRILIQALVFFYLQKPLVTFKAITYIGVSVGISQRTRKRRKGVLRKWGATEHV